MLLQCNLNRHVREKHPSSDAVPRSESSFQLEKGAASRNPYGDPAIVSSVANEAFADPLPPSISQMRPRTSKELSLASSINHGAPGGGVNSRAPTSFTNNESIGDVMTMPAIDNTQASASLWDIGLPSDPLYSYRNPISMGPAVPLEFDPFQIPIASIQPQKTAFAPIPDMDHNRRQHISNGRRPSLPAPTLSSSLGHHQSIVTGQLPVLESLSHHTGQVEGCVTIHGTVTGLDVSQSESLYVHFGPDNSAYAEWVGHNRFTCRLPPSPTGNPINVVTFLSRRFRINDFGAAVLGRFFKYVSHADYWSYVHLSPPYARTTNHLGLQHRS